MVEDETARSGAAGQPTAASRGEVTSAISNAVVSVFAEWSGRGPNRARTVIVDNIVTCVLQGTLTKAETRLLQEGGAEAVLTMRRTYQAMMRKALVEAVEAITGREVVAFLSDHQPEPDYVAEVFVLGRDATPRPPRVAALRGETGAGSGLAR